MIRRHRSPAAMVTAICLVLLLAAAFAAPSRVKAACAEDGSGCFELDAHRGAPGTIVGVTLSGLACGVDPLVMVFAKPIADGGRSYVAMPALRAGESPDRYAFTVPHVPPRRYLLDPACKEPEELGFLPVELSFTVLGPPDTATSDAVVGASGVLDDGWPVVWITFSILGSWLAVADPIGRRRTARRP